MLVILLFFLLLVVVVTFCVNIFGQGQKCLYNVAKEICVAKFKYIAQVGNHLFIGSSFVCQLKL